MNYSEKFQTSTGKSAVAILAVSDAKVSGTVTIDETEYEVTGYHVVNNRKVISIIGAPAPYVVIPNHLYDSILKTCKEQYAAKMTPLQIAEGKTRDAEYKYNRLMRQGYNNVEILAARAEWDRLSAEYHNVLDK